MKLLPAAVIFVLVTGCGSSPPTSSLPPSAGTAAPAPTTAPPSQSVAASPDRVAGWTADIDRLLPGMDELHPELDHGTAMAGLEAGADELKSALATLDDDAVMVRLLRLVASVSAKGRDAHTGIFPWGDDSHYPVHSLPLRLWLFPDGVHVVDALAPYVDVVGSRIDAIAGRATADVVAAIDPVVPRDNSQTVRLLTPRYLLIPEVLHGLGIVDGVGPLELRVVQGGRASAVTVSPIPMAEYNAWAGPYGLHLPADPDVLYLSREDEPLWWERLADGTLFVQYNRVEILDATVRADLAPALARRGVKRVVIDIRHNFGGEVRAIEPVLAAFDTPAVDRSGRLWLFTGRNTFSAASLFAARLQAQTSVRIAGEAMGGSPNAWGNARSLTLEWSGLTVSVATQFELATTVDDARMTIEPDLAAPLTFADWSAGRDPALDAIRESP